MPGPRQWALTREEEVIYGAGSYVVDRIEGAELKPGEQVRVVEAVLTPALIEHVAHVIEDTVEPDGEWTTMAREALRAVGFVDEPNKGEGNGD